MEEGHLVSGPTALKSPEQVIPVRRLQVLEPKPIWRRGRLVSRLGPDAGRAAGAFAICGSMVDMTRPLAPGFRGSLGTIALPNGAERHRAIQGPRDCAAGEGKPDREQWRDHETNGTCRHRHCAAGPLSCRRRIAEGRLAPLLEDCNPGDLELIHATMSVADLYPTELAPERSGHAPPLS